MFTTTVGTPYESHNLRRDFRKVTAAAGLGARWVPKELRTSFVSMMSYQGVPVEEIARLAGHASSRTTEVVYRRGQGVMRSLAGVCLRPGGSRRLRGEACAELAQQVPVLLGVLYHLGPGRRFGAKAPRRQPGAGRAGPRGQGPLLPHWLQ